MKQDHKSELDLQAESLKIEAKSLEVEHESLMQDHEARHREILHEAEEKWKQKLALQLEEKCEEIQNLNGEMERQSEKWAESRRNLEEQLHSVQNELRNQEMAVSAKQKGENLKSRSIKRGGGCQKALFCTVLKLARRNTCHKPTCTTLHLE